MLADTRALAETLHYKPEQLVRATVAAAAAPLSASSGLGQYLLLLAAAESAQQVGWLLLDEESAACPQAAHEYMLQSFRWAWAVGRVACQRHQAQPQLLPVGWGGERGLKETHTFS